MLTILYEYIRTRTPPSKLTLTAKAKMTTGSNITGRARMIVNDSRWGTGHPSFPENYYRIYRQSPPIDSPKRFLHSRGSSAECSWKTVLMLYVAIPTSVRVHQPTNLVQKSPASTTSIFSKAQHDLTNMFTRRDTHEASSSSYDSSSPEVSPSPSPTDFSRLPGTVTVTDVFEHPTHTVTRTVIRPSPSHFVFSLPFKRLSISSSAGSKSEHRSPSRTPDSTSVPDVRSTFEEELDAYEQRWEDERGEYNAADIYVVVDHEAFHEESWRSLVQELHYNHLPPERSIFSECGRW